MYPWGNALGSLAEPRYDGAPPPRPAFSFFCEVIHIALLRIICNCGARLRIADTSRGKSVRCSYCNADIYVPKVYRTRQVTNDYRQGVVWIRATCACSKVIKAPEEWLGKVGKCPKCRRDLALLDMLAEQSPPGADESVAKEVESATGTDASNRSTAPAIERGPLLGSRSASRSNASPTDPPAATGSVSGLLDLTGSSDEPLADPVTGESDLFEARRTVPPPGASIDAAPSPEFSRSKSTRSLRQKLVVDHPVVPYAVAALLAVLSAWNVYRFESSLESKESTRWTPPAAPVYYLDLGTGKPYVLESDVIPPVDAPSKFKTPDDGKGGVRAYFFACGACKKLDNARLEYVERFSKPGKNSAENMAFIITSGQPEPRAREAESQIFSGRQIGDVSGQEVHWEPAESTAASLRLSRLNRKCEDGKRPVLCMPTAEP